LFNERKCDFFYNLLPNDREMVMTLFMVQVMVVVVLVMLLVAYIVVKGIFNYLSDFYFVDHGRFRGVDVSAFVNGTAAIRYTRSRVDGANKSRDELRDSSLLVYSTQTQRNHSVLTAVREAYRIISSALMVQMKQIRKSQIAS
jgi:hypothetical protein